jgi:hypothetical protein
MPASGSPSPGKDATQPRGRRAEHDGAVLEKGRPLPSLRAAHELAAADLQLERAGAREAEGGHGRGIRRLHGDHLDGSAEGAEAGEKPLAYPAIGLEEIVGSLEVSPPADTL